MSFQANCHCGAVAINVDTDLPTKAVKCNCTHCAVKSLVLAAVPGDVVEVMRGEEALKTYRFNRKVIDHRFCADCGVQPYSRGKGRDGTPMAMINLRCVPGIDLDALEIIEYDGLSL